MIQSTKGSFARINVVYTDLTEYLAKTDAVNIGTDMVGENIYHFDFPEKFNLILGNEGNGMRPEVEKLVSKHYHSTIRTKQSTESLNVSMATGIF